LYPVLLPLWRFSFLLNKVGKTVIERVRMSGSFVKGILDQSDVSTKEVEGKKGR
jgi:hypothetical protein